METNYRESLKPDWFTHPKRKHAIIFSVLFLIGVFLISYAATNQFKESPFEKGNLMFLFLIILSGSKVYSIWRNYFRDKRQVIT